MRKRGDFFCLTVYYPPLHLRNQSFTLRPKFIMMLEATHAIDKNWVVPRTRDATSSREHNISLIDALLATSERKTFHDLSIGQAYLRCSSTRRAPDRPPRVLERLLRFMRNSESQTSPLIRTSMIKVMSSLQVEMRGRPGTAQFLTSTNTKPMTHPRGFYLIFYVITTLCH